MKNLSLRNNSSNYLSDFFSDPFDSFFRPMFVDDRAIAMKTDISETDKEYTLEVDLPGYDKKDIKLDFENGYLTVSASHAESAKEGDKKSYIRKERKNLFPTLTGKELIATIHEELLKSAELTGLWEKKLRQIERGTYEARTFLDELKEMVYQVVSNVLSDRSGRQIPIEQVPEKPSKPAKKETKTAKKPRKKRETPAPPRCPLCKKGTILRGKTAYGCSEYKAGCTFRLSYEQYGSDLTDEQLSDIISKLEINNKE